MALFDLAPPEDALIDYFDRERRAILDGRFDILERIAREKARLLESLAKRNVPVETLRRLKTLGDRNAALLAAMQNGVSAARARVANLRAGADLQTYDATGRQSVIATARGGDIHSI